MQLRIITNMIKNHLTSASKAYLAPVCELLDAALEENFCVRLVCQAMDVLQPGSRYTGLRVALVRDERSDDLHIQLCKGCPETVNRRLFRYTLYFRYLHQCFQSGRGHQHQCKRQLQCGLSVQYRCRQRRPPVQEEGRELRFNPFINQNKATFGPPCFISYRSGC